MCIINKLGVNVCEIYVLKLVEGKKVLVWYKKIIVICYYEGVLYMYKCTGCIVGISIIYRSI